MYPHIDTHAVHSLLFSRLIPLDCPQTLLTVSPAPCWLEPHCFTSWIGRAGVVVIVPFFSYSWLFFLVWWKSAPSSQLSALPGSLCAGAPCVCLCLDWKWFSLLPKWLRCHHRALMTSAPGVPWRLVYMATCSSPCMTEQRLRLNSSLDPRPRSFGPLPRCLSFSSYLDFQGCRMERFHHIVTSSDHERHGLLLCVCTLFRSPRTWHSCRS